MSTSAAKKVKRPKVSTPNLRARIATKIIANPCAVRRENKSARVFCRTDLLLRTSLKCNNSKVAPIFERKARLESVIQPAQGGEQARALESEILICSWRRDHRKGPDRHMPELSPPCLLDLAGRIVINGIVESFLMDGGLPWKTARSKPEAAA